MTARSSARTGSAAACLFLVYLGGLVAVTNLIFTAGVTATTRVPSGFARTGAYEVAFAAVPERAALPAPVVAAPVIAAPLAFASAPAREVVEMAAAVTLPGQAQAQSAPGSATQATSHRRSPALLGGRPRQALEKT